MRDYDISSDLRNKTIQKKLRFKQFDNGSTIKVKLYEDSEKVAIETGWTIKANFKRADREKYDRDVSGISDNTFLVTLDSTVTAVVGDLLVDFKITYGDKQVTTSTILLEIEESVGEGNSGDIGGNTGGDVSVDVDLSAYQKKTDNTLNTTDKTIVGAINEISSQFQTIANKFSSEQKENEIILKYDTTEILRIPLNISTNKDVHLFVLSGQSNMQGKQTELVEGECKNAYEYKAVTNTLEILKHPVGEDTTNFGQADYHSIGVKFAELFYSITGEKAIIVQCAKEGTAIASWAVGTSKHTETISKTNSAITLLTEKGYNIKTKNFVWLQGESDALNSTTSETYKTTFLEMWSDLKTQLNLNTCYLIRPAKFPVNSTVVNIMKAQEELAEDNSDIIMTTRITGTFTVANGYMQSNGHYTIDGYNKLGEVVGTNIGNYIKNNTIPILESEPYEELQTVELTQITLNKTSILFDGLNKNDTLTATLTPSTTTQEVNWTSTNESVATIVDGIVTSVAEGECTIKCTNKSDASIYAECKVSVIDLSSCSTAISDSLTTTTVYGSTGLFVLDNPTIPTGQIKAIKVDSKQTNQYYIGICSYTNNVMTVKYVQDFDLIEGNNLLNLSYNVTESGLYLFFKEKTTFNGNSGLGLISKTGSNCIKCSCSNSTIQQGDTYNKNQNIGNHSLNAVLYYTPSN